MTRAVDEAANARLRRLRVVPIGVTLFSLLVSVMPLAAQQRVPLVLEHLMVVLDSATFRDVRASPLFSTIFSAVDSTHGAFELIGKYNSLELVGPKTRTMIVIRLADEQPDRMGQVRRMFGSGPAVSHADGVPWRDRFPVSVIEEELASTRFGVMEFDSLASKRMAERDSMPEDNRTLARFLAPYADRTRLLSAVTGATLAIPVGDIQKIVAAFRTVSATIVTEGDGATIKLDGFTLKLVPPWAGAGVKQLQFALTRAAPANPTYRFGPKSQLRFGPGLIAVWDFEAK